MSDLIRYEPINCWHFWRSRWLAEICIGSQQTIAGKYNPVFSPPEKSCYQCCEKRMAKRVREWLNPAPPEERKGE